MKLLTQQKTTKSTSHEALPLNTHMSMQWTDPTTHMKHAVMAHATWMDLESVCLQERSQSPQSCYMLPCM